MRNNGKSRYGPVQGTQLRIDSTNSGSTPEEEFFCLTPEDARSITSTGSGRSRNASATSTASAAVGGKSASGKTNYSMPIQMGLPDTKIFSVAVEARPAEHTVTDALVVCDVDTDYAGRFAVVSSCYPNKPSVSDYQRKAAAAKAESKRVSDTHTKHKTVREKDNSNSTREIDAASATEKENASSKTLVIGSNKISGMPSVPPAPKILSLETSSASVPDMSSFHEKSELKVKVESLRENAKPENIERNKGNRKGKKKKKGGYTQNHSESQSSIDTSTNVENASSADTDTPLYNSAIAADSGKNKKVLIKSIACSANDNQDNIQTNLHDSKTGDSSTKKNEEFDDIVEKTDDASVPITDSHLQKETTGEIVVSVEENLSSAFALNPNNDVELLKDGSQQSYDNMSTEELLAEALLSTINDEPKEDGIDTERIPDDEIFSSEFSKTLKIKDSEKNEDDDDDDDLEEPFAIKERTPDSDDMTSSDENDASENNKNIKDSIIPVTLVDPEITAHPTPKEESIHISKIKSSISMLMPTPANKKSTDHYENLFANEKQDVDDSGSEIINKIKLAEKIYDNNTEEGDTTEKKDIKTAPRSFAAALNADLFSFSAKTATTESPKTSKQSKSADTSEDDLEITFQPALSRKERRKKKHSAAKADLSRRTSGASFADSESSLIDEDESNVSFENQDSFCAQGANAAEIDTSRKANQEGWSFEADDLDVNRLIAEVVNDNETMNPSVIEDNGTNPTEKQSHEEKACLAEVFKFDSELAVATNVGSGNSEDDDNMEDTANLKEGGAHIQWNNFNTEEETSEDDNASNVILNPTSQKNNKMSKSLNVKVDAENNKIDKDTSNSENDNNTFSSAFAPSKIQNNSKGLTSLSQSLVLGTTTEGTTSESSVGNSPNPRKTNSKKSKKSKKKKF